MESAQWAYTTSKDGTATIAEAITGTADFSGDSHREELAKAHQRLHEEQKISGKAKLDGALMDAKKRAIMRAVQGQTSHWLTALPITRHHFDLSPTEFRDALALQYNRPFLRLPADCDGCG